MTESLVQYHAVKIPIAVKIHFALILTLVLVIMDIFRMQMMEATAHLSTTAMFLMVDVFKSAIIFLQGKATAPVTLDSHRKVIRAH